MPFPDHDCQFASGSPMAAAAGKCYEIFIFYKAGKITFTDRVVHLPAADPWLPLKMFLKL